MSSPTIGTTFGYNIYAQFTGDLPPEAGIIVPSPSPSLDQQIAAIARTTLSPLHDYLRPSPNLIACADEKIEDPEQTNNTSTDKFYTILSDGTVRLTEEIQDLNPIDLDGRLITDSNVADAKMKTESVFALSQMLREWKRKTNYTLMKAPEGYLPGIMESGVLGPFPWAVSGDIGTTKPTMEDRYIAMEFEVFLDEKIHLARFFSVLDGHSGELAVNFVKKWLGFSLQKELSKLGSIKNITDLAIYNTFITACDQTNAKFRSKQVIGGTVASGVLILNNTLYPMNLGDTRTILATDGQAVQLTEDVDCRVPRFQSTVIRRDGQLWGNEDGCRVGGIYAMSRAFGDFDVVGMSARPKVYSPILIESLHPDSYLLIACDGIIDVATSKDLVKSLYDNNPSGSTSQKIADELQTFTKNTIYTSLMRGSKDNVMKMAIKIC
jgi:serine/threonine protein phosphatase PrpC